MLLQGFWLSFIEEVEHACGLATLQMGEFVSNVSNGIDTYSIREPLGVCAGICPFDFPAMIPLWVSSLYFCFHYLFALWFYAVVFSLGCVLFFCLWMRLCISLMLSFREQVCCLNHVGTVIYLILFLVCFSLFFFFFFCFVFFYYLLFIIYFYIYLIS